MKLYETKPSDFTKRNKISIRNIPPGEEKGVTAFNIALMLKKNGDQWKPFTEDDYRRSCNHLVNIEEICYI